MHETLRTKGIYHGDSNAAQFYDDSQILKLIDEELKDINAADKKLHKYDIKVVEQNIEENKIADTEEHIEISNEESATKLKGGARNKKHKTSPKKLPTSKSIKLVEENAGQTIKCSKSLEKELIPIGSDSAADSLTNFEKVNEAIACFDDSLVKMLAYQRLQQILAQETERLAFNPQNIAATVQQIIKAEESTKSIPLPSQLLTKDDIERIAKEFTSPKRENDTLNNQSIDLDASLMTDIKKDSNCNEFLTDHQKICSLSKNVAEVVSHMDIRTRAVITPINIKNTGNNWFETPALSCSFYMRYRSLSIGTGQGNDVQLTKYGSCQYISDKHATIFYDEVTRMFELLNYSEFGTVVNGQYYSCEFDNYLMQKECSTENNQQHTIGKKSKKEDCDDFNRDRKFDKQKIRQEIINLIDITRKCNRSSNNVISNDRMANITQPRCKCPGRNVVNHGWEGTALLYHGTILNFGCLSFVFSITDYDCITEEFEETDNQSEDDT